MAASSFERRGSYIALEGPEGVGKSVQAARLAESIGAMLTRETGGTVVGQRVRAILHDNTLTNLSPRAEAYLVAADRAQHIDEVVRPCLAYRHLVSDRFWWSTVAYQGFGRQMNIKKIMKLAKDATGDCFKPDLVFLLNADREEIMSRMRGRQLDRFESEDPEFFDRVDAGYEFLLDTQKGVLVDTSKGIEATFKVIRDTTRERLGI